MRTCVHGHDCECKELDGKTRPLTWYCPALKKKMNRPWTDLCRNRPEYYALWKHGTHEPSPTHSMIQGPGTELTKILKTPIKFLSALPGVKQGGCANTCLAYARKMNAWGVAGCQERIEEIADYLAAQAKKLNMPFAKNAARAAIKLAIRRAKRRQH